MLCLCRAHSAYENPKREFFWPVRRVMQPVPQTWLIPCSQDSMWNGLSSVVLTCVRPRLGGRIPESNDSNINLLIIPIMVAIAFVVWFCIASIRFRALWRCVCKCNRTGWNVLLATHVQCAFNFICLYARSTTIYYYFSAGLFIFTRYTSCIQTKCQHVHILQFIFVFIRIYAQARHLHISCYARKK